MSEVGPEPFNPMRAAALAEAAALERAASAIQARASALRETAAIHDGPVEFVHLPAQMPVDRGLLAADCLRCAGKPPGSEVVNHSLVWHDGDVVCTVKDCGRYVRGYDAG